MMQVKPTIKSSTTAQALQADSYIRVISAGASMRFSVSGESGIIVRIYGTTK